MYRNLVFCLSLCLLLCSSAAVAQISKEQIASGAVKELIKKPDLIVKSARVTGSPVIFDQGSLKAVIIPLEITVANSGGGTTMDFNVGAEGRALDGNAYGFTFSGPGYETMANRGGVLVHGMAAGTEKTYNGLLLLQPNPINALLQPGTKWEIRAMVDYNLDPDAPYYAWGIDETNEANNELKITYPLTAIVGPMVATPRLGMTQ